MSFFYIFKYFLLIVLIFYICYHTRRKYEFEFSNSRKAGFLSNRRNAGLLSIKYQPTNSLSGGPFFFNSRSFYYSVIRRSTVSAAGNISVRGLATQRSSDWRGIKAGKQVPLKKKKFKWNPIRAKYLARVAAAKAAAKLSLQKYFFGSKGEAKPLRPYHRMQQMRLHDSLIRISPFKYKSTLEYNKRALKGAFLITNKTRVDESGNRKMLAAAAFKNRKAIEGLFSEYREWPRRVVKRKKKKWVLPGLVKGFRLRFWKKYSGDRLRYVVSKKYRNKKKVRPLISTWTNYIQAELDLKFWMDLGLLPGPLRQNPPAPAYKKVKVAGYNIFRWNYLNSPLLRYLFWGIMLKSLNSSASSLPLLIDSAELFNMRRLAENKEIRKQGGFFESSLYFPQKILALINVLQQLLNIFRLAETEKKVSSSGFKRPIKFVGKLSINRLKYLDSFYISTDSLLKAVKIIIYLHLGRKMADDFFSLVKSLSAVKGAKILVSSDRFSIDYVLLQLINNKTFVRTTRAEIDLFKQFSKLAEVRAEKVPASELRRKTGARVLKKGGAVIKVNLKRVNISKVYYPFCAALRRCGLHFVFKDYLIEHFKRSARQLFHYKKKKINAGRNKGRRLLLTNEKSAFAKFIFDRAFEAFNNFPDKGRLKRFQDRIHISGDKKYIVMRGLREIVSARGRARWLLREARKTFGLGGWLKTKRLLAARTSQTINSLLANPVGFGGDFFTPNYTKIGRHLGILPTSLTVFVNAQGALARKDLFEAAQFRFYNKWSDGRTKKELSTVLSKSQKNSKNKNRILHTNLNINKGNDRVVQYYECRRTNGGLPILADRGAYIRRAELVAFQPENLFAFVDYIHSKAGFRNVLRNKAFLRPADWYSELVRFSRRTLLLKLTLSAVDRKEVFRKNLSLVKKLLRKLDWIAASAVSDHAATTIALNVVETWSNKRLGAAEARIKKIIRDEEDKKIIAKSADAAAAKVAMKLRDTKEKFDSLRLQTYGDLNKIRSLEQFNSVNDQTLRKVSPSERTVRLTEENFARWLGNSRADSNFISEFIWQKKDINKVLVHDRYGRKNKHDRIPSKYFFYRFRADARYRSFFFDKLINMFSRHGKKKWARNLLYNMIDNDESVFFLPEYLYYILESLRPRYLNVKCRQGNRYFTAPIPATLPKTFMKALRFFKKAAMARKAEPLYARKIAGEFLDYLYWDNFNNHFYEDYVDTSNRSKHLKHFRIKKSY